MALIMKKIIRKKSKKLLFKFYSYFLKVEKSYINHQNKNFLSKMKFVGHGTHLWGEMNIHGMENIELGNNVHIGRGAFIQGRGGLYIGDNTHISRNMLLYTVNHDYNGDRIPYDEKLVKKPVYIGNNVWVGMNVSIAPGTTIGDGCIIGMGTVVHGNIPPLSIVGNSGWKKIAERDENHYNKLDKARAYGGADGISYSSKRSYDVSNVGDSINTSRGDISIVLHNGEKAIRKTFFDNKEGKESYNATIVAIEKFKNYKWFPSICNVEKDAIVRECYPQARRLDLCINELSSSEKDLVFGKILSALLDIYSAGYAHRDIHAKNIYVLNNNNVKLIDFETVCEQSKSVDFWNSYDITGEGLDSPYGTNNMAVFSKIEMESVLRKLFDVDLKTAKDLLSEELNRELYDECSSFRSKHVGNSSSQRVKLRKANIYSTFNLKNTTITNGQRNTSKRYQQLGINKKTLQNKSVIDIGSNIGGMLLNLWEFDIEKGVGIEFDENKVRLANKLGLINGIDHIKFFQGDAENQDQLQSFGKFDIVFSFAVIEHLTYKNKYLESLSLLCKEKLFFEGNAGTDVSVIIDTLKKFGFKTVTHIGASNDELNKNNNVRPLFVAVK